MNTKKNARIVPKGSDTQPYAMLGAGALTASLWKLGDQDRGWQYRLNIFRMSKVSGRVTQRFAPRDVVNLAKLVQLLAFTISDDGCLESELRRDLSGLATRMDRVLRKHHDQDQRHVTLTEPVATALHEVLRHLRQTDSMVAPDCSANDCLHRHLAVLERWLVDTASNIERPDTRQSS